MKSILTRFISNTLVLHRTVLLAQGRIVYHIKTIYMNIIAIDGYTGTGKWTTSMWVAQALWRTYLDTGAMYRATALYAIRHDMLWNTEEQMAEMMNDIHISFELNTAGEQDTYLNGENVEHLIRTSELWSKMKPVVISPIVRAALATMQAQYGKNTDLVADGRDMATVVFPHAQLKVFMICDIHTRALRRQQQLQSKWLPADLETISAEIQHRDNHDYLWSDAVNKMADWAKILDTTHMTIEEQIQQVVDRWKESNSSL